MVGADLMIDKYFYRYIILVIIYLTLMLEVDLSIFILDALLDLFGIIILYILVDNWEYCDDH